MKCPDCGGETRVFKTLAPRRRRECIACGHRFSTRESVLTPEGKALVRQNTVTVLKDLAERKRHD